MKTIVNHLPVSTHAELTDALKTGCRKVYQAMCNSDGFDARTLDLKSTADMDKALLQACVSFLTFEKVNFKTLVAKRKSESKLPDLFSTRLHHNLALMDLRHVIAEQDSLPWREDHLHYWQDMHVLYESLDSHDRVEIDGFFKLLCNRELSDLTEGHLKKVMSGEVDTRMFADQAPYVASKYLDSLIRADAAEGLFSVDFGDAYRVDRSTSNFDDFSRYSHTSMDIPFGFSPTPRSQFKEIRQYDTKNPGLRFSTFEEALIKGMNKNIEAGCLRQINIYFMGSRMLTAQLGHNTFALTNVFIPEITGLPLSKTMVLDMVQDAEKVMGFTPAMGDFLMAELGM